MSPEEFLKLTPGQYKNEELKTIYKRLLLKLHPDTAKSHYNFELYTSVRDHYINLISDTVYENQPSPDKTFIIRCSMEELILKPSLRIDGLDRRIVSPGYISPEIQYEDGSSITFILDNSPFFYEGDEYGVIWDTHTIQWLTVCLTSKQQVTTFYKETYSANKPHQVYPYAGVPYETMLGTIVRSPLIITKK